jgi:uncharacterized protein with HEPN domain
MSKQHDLKVSLFDMLDSCKYCVKHIEGLTFEQFESDMKTIHAVQHQLLVLGEATKRIDNVFRKDHPDVPWKEMAGTRDVLIHSYEEADLGIIWDIVSLKIPDIIPKIEKLLENQK